VPAERRHFGKDADMTFWGEVVYNDVRGAPHCKIFKLFVSFPRKTTSP